MEETKNDLLTDLQLTETDHPVLETFVRGDHKYIRDMRINLKNTIASQFFSKKEAYLIALAVAANEKNTILTESFSAAAREHGAAEAEIAEAYAVASLLSTLNVYYRFKHFSSNKNYDAKQAGIKMTIMARPVLGKLLFEILSLVVSAVNGCETCVNNHEQSVRNEGGTEDQIFDAVRLGSVVKGLSAVIY
ncbi:MAG: carboxymuconolactone decarboxylase family protein [Acidobacteriota bacterium]